MNTGSAVLKLDDIFVFIAKISIVIGTAALMILLVIKMAQCQFYEIPLNYSSLDIKSILPFGLFGFLLFFGTFFDVIQLKTDNVHIRKPNSFRSVVNRCLQSIPVAKRIKDIIKNKKRTTIVRRKIEKTKKEDSYSEQALDCLPIVLLYSLILFNAAEIILKDYSCAISSLYMPEAYMFNIIIAIIIKMVADRRMIKWGKRIERNKQKLVETGTKQKTEEDGQLFQEKEDRDESNYHNFKIYINGVFLLLFLVEVYLGSSVAFYIQRQYDTFTVDRQEYAIVEYEDDNYVAKPVEISNNRITLNMNQYMYIEKNKVIINRVIYNQVYRTK